MKYVRKWVCAVCGEAVIVDTKEKTITCDCEKHPYNLKGIKASDFLENFELLCL